MLWFMNKAEGNPQKRKIITRINGYHGVTAVSASITAKPYNEVFGLHLDGFIHTDCPHYWRFSQDGESESDFTLRLARNLEALIVSEGPETIAALVAEPVMGAGGVIPPSKGYFQAIHPILKKYNIALIADEVICGFGRTGPVWGCQAYDFMPDAIISSKNLTAGYFPMGAVILGPNLANKIQMAAESVEEFPHGFTASGHPVGCAIALKAINVILNEGLIENVQALTPKFEQGLAELAKNPNIGEARSKGLMGALERSEERRVGKECRSRWSPYH